MTDTGSGRPVRRRQVLERLQLVMGEFPPPARRVPLDVKILEDVEDRGLRRRKLTFAVEEGDRCWAWLLLPPPSGAPRPAMLCLHQTTGIGKNEPAGLGGNPNYQYARELAQRGYVTLAPDCENFGEYKVDLYAQGYASATMKNVWNHMRAVDLLAALPEVDPDRIGCIGHSHGGHNSLFLAAFDPRIKLVVSSCGFTRFTWSDNEGRGKPGDLGDWSGSHYMPRIAERYGARAENLPFDIEDVLGLIAPRPLFINAPTRDRICRIEGVKECLALIRPVYEKRGAADRLVCEQPEGGHDFPPEVRQRAYDFIDRLLGPPARKAARKPGSGP